MLVFRVLPPSGLGIGRISHLWMEGEANRVTETSLRESIIAIVVLSLGSKREPELSIMQ